MGKEFPIKQTWTPGEYGEWGEFESKIKEAAAAATYVTPGHKKDLKGMIFDGQGVRRDGSKRRWDHAEATGNYFVSRRDGAVMIEVVDGGQRRHLNIGTFSGDAVTDNALYEFKNGSKRIVSQKESSVKIASMLDGIADSLENKGYLKEAEEIDAIANTIESALIDPEMSGQSMGLKQGPQPKYEFQRKLKRKKGEYKNEHIKLPNGLIFSIQCSDRHYCEPRKDIQDPTAYTKYEFAIMGPEDAHNFLVIPGFEKYFDRRDQNIAPDVPAEKVEKIFQAAKKLSPKEVKMINEAAKKPSTEFSIPWDPGTPQDDPWEDDIED